MADPVDDIRRLVYEASAMKTKPLPGTASLLTNHPGAIAYETDSEKEWENDQRRKHLLAGLTELYPTGDRRIPPEISDEMIRYARGKIPDIETPYHYRGWYTPGAPLYGAIQGMMLAPSLAYSVSARAANAVDPDAPFDPEAKRKFDSTVNSFGATLPEYMGLVPKGTPTLGTAAEERRLSRGNLPWHWEPSEWNGYVDDRANRDMQDMYIDGKQHWMRTGVPEVPALFLGAMSDSVLDPYTGWANAVKNARMGNRAAAAMGLAKEYGWGTGGASVGALGLLTKPRREPQ
ncbi:MAG: hypothetical protein EBR82_70060 [Caulobacteraceae bacterium]|nr:hypothetical protein [Caulobacteraceae bacterium]